MKKLVVGLAVLAVAALALLASHAGPASPVSAIDGNVYTVEQDGFGPVIITPLGDGTTTVGAFYNYDQPPCVDSANTGLEISDTSQLFLYRGSSGLSLVMIHDLPACDQDFTLAGEADFAFALAGVPAAAWLVTDDDYNDTYAIAPTTGSASWGWSLCCTDGGALGYLDCPFEITITPDFHPGIGASPIGTWVARSGLTGASIVTFPNLTDPVTITCSPLAPTPTPTPTPPPTPGPTSTPIPPTPTPTPGPVGGIVELLANNDTPAEASGSSSARDYTAPIAAAVAAGALALAAGGWYVRRRWLR